MDTDRSKKQRSANPYIWSFTTYFTEGFPYTIIRTISSVFFRDRGVSLEAIGLTSFFSLPWILKFLWGPQVDEFGTKRKWLLLTQGFLVVVFLSTAFIVPIPGAVKVIAFLFFIASFVAATHDIAIDGYYMEALDKDGQAKFLGYRVMAYRIAMMTGTGIIVTIGTTSGWFLAFLGAGILMGLFFLFHLIWLPVCEDTKKSFTMLASAVINIKFILTLAAVMLLILIARLFFSSGYNQILLAHLPILCRLTFADWAGILLLITLILLAVYRKRLHALLIQDRNSYYAKAFISFMDREKTGVMLAFIIFIRTGEYMLSSMAAPFMIDLGIKVHYGWIAGGVGLPCSIAGAIFGGWLISQYSLKKMIWPFLLAQNLTNIIYMILAFILSDMLALNTGNPTPDPIGILNLIMVAGVHGFDQFAGGLGTAVLMTYLMRICEAEHKAAHYAIGTGLMSVSGLYAGSLSGFLASWLGYGPFFGISFIMSIPGMMLIFFTPFLKEAGRELCNQ